MLRKKKIILNIILSCFMALCITLGVFWLSKPVTSFAVEETHNHASFTAWGEAEEEKGSLPKVAGSYYLTNDIYLSDTWTAPSGTVNLCLNGKSVLMNEECDVISVPSGATLNIYECDKTEQDVYGIKVIGGYIMATSKYGEETKAIKGITVSGTLNVYGGTLLGAKTGIYVLNGNFNMFGGAITANVHNSEETDTYGAGVLVDGGSFTMNGGKIYGNRLNAHGREDIVINSFGAGVFVDNDGSFTMNGGEIYGNESYYGSGIYVKNGTFTMTGGEIHDNEEGCYFGAGLFVAENSTASLTGGKIYNNTVRDYDGGAGVYSKGDLSLGGTIQIVNNTYNYDGIGRSNLYIDNSGSYDKDVSLISPENGMLVGVSMSSLTTFTDIVEIGNEKYFFADNEDEYIFYDGHIKLENRKGKYDRIYKIDIEYCEHGVVYANMQAVYENIIEETTVYLTVVPEDGYVLKSLKYNGNDITQEKSFAMPGEDVTVTAKFEKDIKTVIPEKQATCTEASYLEYYIFNGHYFSDKACTNEILDLEAWKNKGGAGYVAPLGHDYNIVYVWNGNKCTATATCKHDNTHKVTETVTAEFVTDTNATCTEKTKGHYKAEFINEVFNEQNTAENSVEKGDTPRHDYETIYVWNGNKCTAIAVCKNDNSHTITETVTGIYVKDTKATRKSNEKGHYEATFNNTLFEKQATDKNSIELADTMLVEENSGCFGAINISNLCIITSLSLIAFGIMMIIRKRKNKKI